MNHFYNQNIDEVLWQFDVTAEKGLSAEEAKKRFQQYGPNQLETIKQKTTWQYLSVNSEDQW